MAEPTVSTYTENYGSEALNEMLKKLKATPVFLTRRKSKKNGIKVKDEYSCEFTQYLMPKSIDNRTRKAPKN